MMEWLTHGRMRLALRRLTAADGPSLLLLHGLGERSPDDCPSVYRKWPGPVWALDFTGHGQSTVPLGGGYTAEILMADVDAALRHLGTATIVGRGLGAYVGLLAAGGRPQLVRGAVLLDGPGLAGGGSGSITPFLPTVDTRQPSPPDPFAMAELALDVRPPDYATFFARQAAELSGLSRPISVCACERPEWLAAVVCELGVEETNLAEALDHHQALAGQGPA
ncbi:MAG: alpha/beta hydrolase [Myxococcales bacterium]|nr:alpha/beta hydrolase [Myxococcales bacterium]